MEKLSEQLLKDANNRFIDKNELLEACLSTLTADQLYEMAIQNGFLLTKEDVSAELLDQSKSSQEKIIDAVLARHGE
mgnify:FL=1|jgi:hypothetical protein|tara:strand:- start:2287 stop:2517 length:231 start_codon:yes stop_codon:yes gene_type:complete